MKLEMKYTDTILKQSDFKWKLPDIKYKEDDNVDLIITVQITDLLKKQAFRAFNYGIVATFKFLEATRGKTDEEYKIALDKQIKEWQKP